MRRNYLIKIWMVSFVLVSVVSYAQVEPELPGRRASQVSSEPANEIEPSIKLWQLDGFGAFQDSSRLDTLTDYFHLYHPAFKDAITVTYLGNYGTPILNNNFFQRNSNPDFFFLKYREAYLLNPSKIKYYNTRTPYTLLDFTQSEHRTMKNETRFNVLHSQNINPYLNVTFRYDQARSVGQYKNQETKNSSVSLYSSYNKDKINIYGGFISNTMQNQENGGFDSDTLIFSDDDTDLLNVNLTSTHAKFGSTYFFANGEYRLGKYDENEEQEITNSEGESELRTVSVFKPVVGFLYSFQYQNHFREFVEDEDTTLFFRNTYYGDDYKKDSVRFGMVQNTLQIKQYENPDRKTSFGKRVFIGQQFVKTSSPGPIREINNRQTKRYSNIYLGGGIYRQTGKFWRWNFEGKFYLLGRNTGQTEFSGLISKPLSLLGDTLAGLSIKGGIENLVPDYYQEEYYSNHSRWKNDLKMEQKMTAQGSFKSPQRNLELRFNYSIINNFIYNDTLAVPSQHEGQLLVLSAFADKDFNYGNLHFRTRFLWQKSSNQNVLHLPDFSAFVSAYYKFVVSKVLFSQIGIDTRYNTKYFADAYDPSTGFFHLQFDKKLGGFPYIDAHVNLKLKRTRIFFKMMNIGSEFIHKEYFTTPHYPMNRMTFRMGVAWAFYD